MVGSALSQGLADAVLVLHLAVVLFVVGGAVFVVAGNLRGWPQANALGFRLLHLLAIGWVALQAWLGAVCPLTTLENWLRLQARQTAVYQGSFIEHWVQRLLFYEAPAWVFVLAYSLFAALAAWLWRRYPPRRPRG